jgi:hypothetical protein
VLDAETENRRLGPSAFDLLIGKDPLSRPWVVDSLIKDMGPTWAADYQAITGHVLDAAEIIALFEWLAQRSSDAFVVVAALHRVRRAKLRRAPNDATRQMVVRALADLVVRFNESYPSAWKSAMIVFDENNRARSEVFAGADGGGKSVAGEHGWINEGAATARGSRGCDAGLRKWRVDQLAGEAVGYDAQERWQVGGQGAGSRCLRRD